MKKTLLLTLCTAALAAPVSADTILGLYVGGDYWQADASGNFGSNNTTASFDFEDEGQTVSYVALEHPIPFVPNVKLRHNDLTTNGVTALTSSFQFGGETYSIGTTVATDTDLSHTDIILYYEVLDNSLLSLDLGLNVKYLDGAIRVQDVSANPVFSTVNEELSGPIPMAYAKVQVGFPLTGLDATAEVNALQIGDDSATDILVGLEYEFIDSLAIDAAIRAGYRSITVDVEDFDDITADIEFDGFYAGIQLHF